MGRLGWILAALGGAAAVGGVAYLASGGAAKPTAGGASGGAAPPPPSQTSLDVVLTPGVSPTIALSLNGKGVQANNISFVVPQGATVPSINLLSNDANVVKTSGYTATGAATAQAVAVGSATLIAAWTDATGTAQTSQIPVTVSA